MFGKQENWKSWKDIQKWAEKNGFTNLSARMQLNNDCWMSSGEFGRSQTQICDDLRFADNEEEALKIASAMDGAFSENFGLW